MTSDAHVYNLVESGLFKDAAREARPQHAEEVLMRIDEPLSAIIEHVERAANQRALGL